MEEYQYKHVIDFRIDLKLSKGKIAAQAGHAAVSAAEETRKCHKAWWRAWKKEGQRKIALKVEDEEGLLKLERQAKALDLPYALIMDRGLTEIPPDTITCLGIGPAPAEKMNRLTSNLQLL